MEVNDSTSSASSQNLSFYAPAMVGLFIVFVVVPVIAFGIRAIGNWLLG